MDDIENLGYSASAVVESKSVYRYLECIVTLTWLEIMATQAAGADLEQLVIKRATDGTQPFGFWLGPPRVAWAKDFAWYMTFGVQFEIVQAETNNGGESKMEPVCVSKTGDLSS